VGQGHRACGRPGEVDEGADHDLPEDLERPQEGELGGEPQELVVRERDEAVHLPREEGEGPLRRDAPVDPLRGERGRGEAQGRGPEDPRDPPDEGRGLDALETSLRDAGFRARFFARREWAAMVRTTFAVNMLRGSEKLNVIPSEAVADIDCRMLAGDDPHEIRDWVARAVNDEHVEVAFAREPKIPNLSPPDTALYKAMADALRRRAPGAVVAPMILVAFTDNWVFRRCGLHSYGFSPFVLEDAEFQRIHGNDERISLENVREGVRAYTEMLVDVAGA